MVPRLGVGEDANRVRPREVDSPALSSGLLDELPEQTSELLLRGPGRKLMTPSETGLYVVTGDPGSFPLHAHSRGPSGGALCLGHVPSQFVRRSNRSGAPLLLS